MIAARVLPAPTETRHYDEPCKVHITLSVCGCYQHERPTFITDRASKVAVLLGLSLSELECQAVTAMFMGRPQIVATYAQHDLAKQRLFQLRALTPFLIRSSHSFALDSKT